MRQRATQIRNLILKVRRRLGFRGIKRTKRFPLYLPQTRWELLRLRRTQRLTLQYTMQLGNRVSICYLKYLVLGKLLRMLYFRYPLLLCGRVGVVDKFSGVRADLLLDSLISPTGLLLAGVVRSIGRKLLNVNSCLSSNLGGGGFVLYGVSLSMLLGLYQRSLGNVLTTLGIFGVKLDSRLVTCNYFIKTLMVAKQCIQWLATVGANKCYFGGWIFRELSSTSVFKLRKTKELLTILCFSSITKLRMLLSNGVNSTSSPFFSLYRANDVRTAGH